jgi:hypothetical protein
MLKNVIFVVAMMVCFVAGATDGDHSEDVCSTLNPAVCAHLGHMTKVNSTDEVQFVTHVMTPQNKAISNLKVDLWMQMGNHGHGSSPVKLTQFATNKFRVTEAYFVMTGQWLVRVSFDYENQTHKLAFPVTVSE